MNFFYLLCIQFILLFTHTTLYANAIKNNRPSIVTMKPIPNNLNSKSKASHKPKPLNKIHTTYRKKHKYSKQEVKCLAQTLYYEARGEPFKGKVAVGNVVMNRVKSNRFPNTICQVMKERNRRFCQFSFVCNGAMNKPIKKASWASSLQIAQDILNNKLPKYANKALFFHANYIKKRMPKHRYTVKIGQHYFYK